MPKIPTQDNITQQANVLPAPQIANTLTQDVATAAPKQMQQQNLDMLKAQSNSADIQADAMMRANQLRVDDAINMAKEAQVYLTYDTKEGFSNIKGRDAMERPDGVPLADEYTEKLRQRLATISGSLSNDAQRQAFHAAGNNIMGGFHANITQHEGSEFRTYAMSVRDGTIRNAIDDIGRNYNNPELVANGINQIKASGYDIARMEGKSAEWSEAHVRELTSKAHKTAVMSALQNNNPQYADDYVKKNAKDMSADDILAVNGVLTKDLDGKLALDTASQTMRDFAPRILTPDVDRAFNIAVGTESNNRQFGADGKPLTSKAGAIGIAQVMPDTAQAAAKMAGIEWDEQKYKNDPEYNKALGKAYFSQQLKDFSGNVSKAYAAYNAGPRWVKEAEQRAAAAAPGTQEADWFYQLNNDARKPENREETKNYVTKNVNAYGVGAGQAEKPTLYEVQQEVRRKMGTENPQRLKLALDEVERQYIDFEKSVKQRDDQNVTGAMRALMQNGGRYTDLPAEMRAAIPPNEVVKVMDFGAKIAKGDDSTNLFLYNKLASNPEMLAKLSDDQFFQLRSELSETDFKHFSNERAGYSGGGSSPNSPDNLNSTGINSVLNDQLRMRGLDPSPKDGSAEAGRLGAIRKFVNDSVLIEQRRTGKKLSDREVSELIDFQFSRTAAQSSMWNFSGNSPATGRMLGMSKGDIPGKERSALQKAFKARGIDNPSEADMLDAYWRGQSVGKKAEK